MHRMSKAPATQGPADPYPEHPGRVSDFSYEDGLMLLRLKDAVSARKGRDADYIVGADYTITYHLDGTGPHKITVPRGMMTDLVSVPPLFRTWVGRVGPYLEAAIVHDYLYIAWQDEDGGVPRKQDRRFADQLFLVGMRAAKVRSYSAWPIYVAVRLMGGFAYWRREKERYVDLSDPTIVAQFPRPIGEALARSCGLDGQAEL
ncbi:DUF1353 domain-containing protein [Halovulum sp. GXIMD14793]